MGSSINEIAKHEASRDNGLLRVVGVWGLAFSIVNCVVGAGIFSLPSSMADYAGDKAPLAFVICAIAMSAIVLCFAEAASRVPTSGGSYGYVEAAFGPLTGLIAGVLLWLAAILACGGIVSALADGVTSFLPNIDKNILRPAIIIIAVGGLAYINILGADKAAGFIGIATIVKLVPLALFVIIGGAYLLKNGHQEILKSDSPQFGRAIILAIFAFSGMETPLGASGEVANPQKTIPKALFIGMGFVLVLYLAIQFVAQGLLGADLAKSHNPLADGIKLVFAPIGIILLIGASLSRFIWLASDLLGAPRILFAFARDGSLPKPLAMVHKKYATPHIAIIFHAGLAIFLAISGSFEQLAVLSSLATAALYILSCAAAWKLAKDKVAIFGEPLNLKFLPIISSIGIISMVCTIFLAQKNEIIGLISVIIATIIYYYFIKNAKSKTAQ